MGRRPKFDAEFRAHAVEMVRVSGRPRYQVAKDLGVSDTTLAKWMVKDKSNDDAEPLSVSEREDYERLQRAERVWLMEREILKKGMSFWVKESIER
jgi:transposase